MTVVNTNLVLKSDRYLNTAVLLGDAANTDGDTDWLLTVPAGVGDCLVLELAVFGFPAFATLATTPFQFGIFAGIVGVSDTSFVDLIGTAMQPGAWSPYAGTVAAPTGIVSQTLKPDSGVLCKDGERIRILFPEFDTNAAPTADWQVIIKVQRLRVPAVLDTEVHLVAPPKGTFPDQGPLGPRW